MIPEEIIKYKNLIVSHLENRQLHDALRQLLKLIQATAAIKYNDELEEIERSYLYMIQYMADGTTDPQRDEVYHKIIMSLYNITDKITNELLIPISPNVYYSNIRYEKLQNTPLNISLQKYIDTIDKNSLYDLIDSNQQEESKINELKAECEFLENIIFKKIWISFPSSANDIAVMENALRNDTLPLYFRELIVSAIFLSLIENFDENKIMLLLNSYEASETTIQLKALSALLIILHKYHNRIAFSKNLRSRIEILKDNKDFENDVKAIFLQFIRSRDTERITKKMREELLPGLMKISPEIYRKIKDNDGSMDIEGLEENPLWQDMLDQTGMTKKMEELNEMQMEGGDVFMGTFAHLKSYQFFNEISNWFIPYHANHSINSKAFGKEAGLSDIISKAPFLCNSDKYSFALSLISVPEMQRKLMLSQFSSQNIDMSEMRSSELITNDKERENIANKYVQDLYRFFKLYGRKSDFYDPFATSLNLLQIPFMESIFTDIDTLRLIGEFYFKHGYYNDALEFFNNIIENSEPTAEIYQKIGFCYQSIGNTDMALDYYLKSELLSATDTWTLRHIAACYRSKKATVKALEYYRRAETILPENLNIIMNIGHCLLELEKPIDAVKYYYKVDYLSSKGSKAWRPIAWCEFLSGNYAQSKIYYDKIMQDNPSSQDYLNIGHLALVRGNIKEAIGFYKESIIKEQRNMQSFIASFNTDLKYLINAGVKNDDIPLILDKLSYDID